MEEQDRPGDIQCPNCHLDVTDQFEQKHRLSETGYLHDDIGMECTECGHSWPHGVPINPGPNAISDGDLDCPACNGHMRVHRVDTLPDANMILLQLKCPDCFYFTKTGRSSDSRGVSLVGHPDITGEINVDSPEGFDPDKIGDIQQARRDSGVIGQIESRLQEQVPSGGIEPGIRQKDVPLKKDWHYEPPEEEIPVFKGFDTVTPVGKAGNLHVENGILYADVNMKGKYWTGDSLTVAPGMVEDLDTGNMFDIALVDQHSDRSLQGNLTHDDDGGRITEQEEGEKEVGGR